MIYENLQNFISTPKLYANIADDEVATIPVSYFITNLGGINYVGSYEPIDAFADRELIPTPVVETPPDSGTDVTTS